MHDDPTGDDWLTRHTPEEWLAAATLELAHAVRAFETRQHRKGVTHARRSAGMALNALLRHAPNDDWGRTYVEHLRAVASDETVDPIVRESARDLLDAPLNAPRLVGLGKGAADHGLPGAAATCIEWVKDRLGGPSAA